jgi:hypothetical protein
VDIWQRPDSQKALLRPPWIPLCFSSSYWITVHFCDTFMDSKLRASTLFVR